MPYNSSLSRYWLLLGVAALAIAGLFALVLVIARTPSLAHIPLFARLFHEALVVHVDLSVLVWFLSIACLMWSLFSAPSPALIPCLEEAALISSALGTLAIAASPLDSRGEALMSNYIPVITSPVFFLGLSLLFCGTGLMVIKLFTSRIMSPQYTGFLRFTIASAAGIALVGMIAFCWSFKQMPKDMAPGEDGVMYYEYLFWGGGHVLQFLHAQVLLACWFLLAVTLRPQFSVTPFLRIIMVCIGPLTVLSVPLVYMHYTVDSNEQREWFTRVMVDANGIAPALLALFVIPALWQTRGGKNALWSTLAMSVLLFIYGGMLGEIIRGQNVVIPAHYHGSIVGITLGFMGVAYLLLPQFGYKDVSRWKLAYWQPFVYGGGQILHISGLAWSGGYGVLRKTPGGMEALSTSVKAAMGLMGLGGLIAIIGGFMFVIVVFKGVRSKD